MIRIRPAFPARRIAVAWISGGLTGLIACSPDVSENAGNISVVLEGSVDFDGDGVFSEHDCDDTDAQVAPGQDEIPYDGIDQNCDGEDLIDQDSDGFSAIVVEGADCDDANSAINPEADEIPNDGVDQDCSGMDLLDADVDGFESTASGGSDCNDGDGAINSAATEVLDGADNDCDSRIDETPYGDTFTLAQSSQNWVGMESEAYLGSALVVSPDIDRGGADDLIIGSPGSAQVQIYKGETLFQGGAVSEDVRLEGASQFGSFVAALGDSDGGGIADFVMAAAGSPSSSGRVYVVFGETVRWNTTQWVEDIAPAIFGEAAGDSFGQAALGQLDFNRDGQSDLVVSAPTFDVGDRTACGAIYIVTERPTIDWSGKTIGDLASLWIQGVEAGMEAGSALIGSDFDQDGKVDLAFGAPGIATAGSQGGSIGVFFGVGDLVGKRDSDEADFTLTQAAEGGDGTADYGAAFGTAISSCDINGDAYPDLLVGAPGFGDQNTPQRGRVTVWYGGQNRWSGNDSTSSATGHYLGQAAGDLAGQSLACAGDINGDGYQDLLVGSPGRDDDRGSAFVIYGSAGGFPQTGVLGQGTSELAGKQSGDRVGSALAVADLDRDGWPDLFVAGSNYSSSSYAQAGVVYGQHGSATP